MALRLRLRAGLRHKELFLFLFSRLIPHPGQPGLGNVPGYYQTSLAGLFMVRFTYWQHKTGVFNSCEIKEHVPQMNTNGTVSLLQWHMRRENSLMLHDKGTNCRGPSTRLPAFVGRARSDDRYM